MKNILKCFKTLINQTQINFRFIPRLLVKKSQNSPTIGNLFSYFSPSCNYEVFTYFFILIYWECILESIGTLHTSANKYYNAIMKINRTILTVSKLASLFPHIFFKFMVQWFFVEQKEYRNGFLLAF
jgi:hypothetical protein